MFCLASSLPRDWPRQIREGLVASDPEGWKRERQAGGWALTAVSDGSVDKPGRKEVDTMLGGDYCAAPGDL